MLDGRPVRRGSGEQVLCVGPTCRADLATQAASRRPGAAASSELVAKAVTDEYCCFTGCKQGDEQMRGVPDRDWMLVDSALTAIASQVSKA